jgi:hypothetical protein
MDPLIWCENFAIECLWKPGYSSSILGQRDRPPLFDLLYDLRTMCVELTRYGLQDPCLVDELLQKGSDYNLLTGQESMDRKKRARACRGLLVDLYRIMIARRMSNDGWLDTDSNNTKNTADAKTRQFFSETTMFPGPDSLRLGKPLIHPSEAVKAFGMLDDLTASFIHSGPFRLRLTTLTSHHLTMNKDGEIFLFWEGAEHFEKRHDIPGRKRFIRYTTHTLRKFFPLNH